MSWEGRLKYREPPGGSEYRLARSKAMNCKSCTSQNQRTFNSEINVHFLELKYLDEPSVFVFPKLVVRMDCGFTEFAIPETELRLLGKPATGSGATRFPALAGRVDLSESVSRLPFSISEIESLECAADEPLALKNGFYRH